MTQDKSTKKDTQVSYSKLLIYVYGSTAVLVTILGTLDAFNLLHR